MTEEFFPEHNIRLIAVSDGIDTDEGENELAPIRNLFNEWYARDISKKRRISNKIRGAAGEPLCKPPYGYVNDPENPKHWIIDEEAAHVVRRIYSMTLEGFGTDQITTALEEDQDGLFTIDALRCIGACGIAPAISLNGNVIPKVTTTQVPEIIARCRGEEEA